MPSQAAAPRPTRWRLAVVHFCEMLSLSLVVPLLPNMGEEVGLERKSAGMVGSLYGAVQLLASPLAGVISDGVEDRRTVLATSQLLVGFSYLVLGAAVVGKSIPLFLASRMLTGLFKHTSLVTKALVTDSCAGSDRASALGLLYTTSGVAFATGPVAAGLVARDFGLPAVGYISFVGFALCSLATCLLLESSPAISHESLTGDALLQRERRHDGSYGSSDGDSLVSDDIVATAFRHDADDVVSGVGGGGNDTDDGIIPTHNRDGRELRRRTAECRRRNRTTDNSDTEKDATTAEDTDSDAESAASGESAKRLHGFWSRFMSLSPQQGALLVVRMVVGLAVTMLFTSYKFVVQDSLDLGPLGHGYITSLFSTGGMFAHTFVVGQLRARMCERDMAARASVFMGLGAFGIVVATSPAMTCVALLLMAMSSSVLRIGFALLLASTAAPQERGKVFGLADSVMSLARVAGPGLAGLLNDRGTAAPVTVAGVACIAVGVLIQLTVASDQSNDDRGPWAHTRDRSRGEQGSTNRSKPKTE